MDIKINISFIFYYSIRSFQCVPKNEKHNQLLNSLTIDEERCLSQHSSANINKAKSTKNDKNNANKIDIDEHKQIALFAKQLTLIVKKQKPNSTGIQPQIRFPFNQYDSQRRYINHRSAEKKLMIFKLEAENR